MCGGTKNKLFWQSLAQLPKVVTIWGIDGLEDTNHIYRQNVKWDKLMENISYYMSVGGRGAWQFIVFEHNKHQLDMARLYADDLGFFGFLEVNSRKPNPKTPEVKIDKRPESSCVTCKATYENSDLGQGFFIDVKGNVWPCCWMGTHEESNKVAIKYLQSQGQMIFDEEVNERSKYGKSMNRKDLMRKHGRELKQAVRKGSLDLSQKAEEDLLQHILDYYPEELRTDDDDDWVEWLDNNLEDFVKGKGYK